MDGGGPDAPLIHGCVALAGWARKTAAGVELEVRLGAAARSCVCWPQTHDHASNPSQAIKLCLRRERARCSPDLCWRACCCPTRCRQVTNDSPEVAGRGSLGPEGTLRLRMQARPAGPAGQRRGARGCSLPASAAEARRCRLLAGPPCRWPTHPPTLLVLPSDPPCAACPSRPAHLAEPAGAREGARHNLPRPSVVQEEWEERGRGARRPALAPARPPCARARRGRRFTRAERTLPSWMPRRLWPTCLQATGASSATRPSLLEHQAAGGERWLAAGAASTRLGPQRGALRQQAQASTAQQHWRSFRLCS